MTSKAFGLAQLGNAYNDGALSNRNKIINGAMVIDQRNAGAAVSISSTSLVFSVDRWMNQQTQGNILTVQQNQGSVTPPVGFSDYLGSTVDTAYSIAEGDFFLVSQGVEGFNITDLNWGTANAKSVTLSFWARSSLTGNFGGALDGGGANQVSHPFSYTLPTANTWTYITVVIAGPTIGSWNSSNALGVYVRFGLGVGPDRSGPAGSWASTRYFSVPGATSVVGTLDATWQVTGVQLEAGDTATPFEHRSYGQELALCQRYYEAGSGRQNIRNPSIADNNPFGALVGTHFQVSKRAAPTIALGTATVSGCYTNSGSTENITTSGFAQILLAQTSGAVSNMTLTQPWTASAEL